MAHNKQITLINPNDLKKTFPKIAISKSDEGSVLNLDEFSNDTSSSSKIFDLNESTEISKEAKIERIN